MNLTTAEDAQTAFYEAFAKGDVGAMMAVWSNQSDTICIHPGSIALEGFEAIKHSWTIILGQEESLEIQSTPLNSWVDGHTATLTVTEHILIKSRRVRGETLATNAFRLEDGLWRMTLHHGSPKPSEPESNPSTEDGPSLVH